MWRRLTTMVRKEFTQLTRDLPIMFVLLWGFTGAIYSSGHATSMETHNYPLVIFDLSRSPDSRELIARLRRPYFKIVRYVYSDAELTQVLDAGKASVAVIIPPDFQRQIERGQGTFQVISDGTLALSAIIAGTHIARIAGEYGVQVLEARSGASPGAAKTVPHVDARIRIEYNPNAINAWFSSMLELFNITTMVSMLLTAAAMVREKEYATLEQLLMTPVRPTELFIAKIIPTIVMVLLFSSVALFGVIQGIFHAPIRGNVLFFYAVSALYVLTTSTLGLTIAVATRTIAQAMMLLLVIMYPMIFLSGSFTPPESMAPWMQWASLLSPMRYYLDFGYQVLFKGNGLFYVWHDIVGIVVLGALMFGIAVWRFRRLVRS